MNLDEIYSQILKICKENYISEPFLVGGIPRDLFLNRFERDEKSRLEPGLVPQRWTEGEGVKYMDIDITTNDSDVTRLAILCADKFKRNFKLFSDRHISVYLKSTILDFSSHFISKKAVDYIAKELSIKDKKLFEVYSRDFTVNTLHKRFFDDETLDPTGWGKEDLSKKIIRTVLPSEITLTDDFRRIYRAINFAARLGFSIDSDIVEYARSNREKFSGENKWILKEAFITSIIGEAISNDADITMHYLNEMDLLPTVSLCGSFKEELIKRKLVKKYLDDAVELTKHELKNIEL